LLLTGCGWAQSLLPAAAPTPVPGIDAPLTVEGIQLQVISIARQDTYEVSSQQEFVPNSPWDECLIVEASIKAYDPQKAQGWEVSVTDENGRESKSNLTSTETDASGVAKGIMWLFVVATDARSLTLHLLDGQSIQLDTLLASSSASTSVPGKIPDASPGVPEPNSTPSPTVGKIVLTATSATIAIPYCKEAKANGSISGNTYVCLSSEKDEYLGGGESWLLMPVDSGFSVDGYGHNLIIEVGEQQEGWGFQFAPPIGQSLAAGLYENADLDFSTAAPYISISGRSKGCDAGTTTGKFEVLELVYTPGNPSVIEQLAVNFEYHCNGWTALWGVIRFNSTVAP
jgi:hypothetical protein